MSAGDVLLLALLAAAAVAAVRAAVRHRGCCGCGRHCGGSCSECAKHKK